MAALGFVAVVLAAACACQTAWAQVYEFKDMQVPKPKTVEVLQAFFVYSHDDSPGSVSEDAAVRFQELGFRSEQPTQDVPESALPSYISVQVSLVTDSDIGVFINSRSLCSTEKDVRDGSVRAKDQLLLDSHRVGARSAFRYSHTVPFHPALGAEQNLQDTEIKMPTTGIYYLVLSNCGGHINGTLKGSVAVKNPFGFLPGDEYYKLPFFAWLSVFYLILGLVWLVLCVRWYQELVRIHHWISAILALGVLEAAISWFCFNDLNREGHRRHLLFCFMGLVSVTKTGLGYISLVIGASGWGVTQQSLDDVTVRRIHVMAILYFPVSYIATSVLGHRHSQRFAAQFMFASLGILVLLVVVIFYWIFSALSGVMQLLRERSQESTLVTFQRSWNVLTVALLVAVVPLVLQVLDITQKEHLTNWQYQWLISDGVWHMLFLIFLGVFMLLWQPQENMQQYHWNQVSQDDDGKEHEPIAVWADEEEQDEGKGPMDDDEQGFWTKVSGPGGARVAPETIGAVE